jgi:hypothetical protein
VTLFAVLKEWWPGSRDSQFNLKSTTLPWNPNELKGPEGREPARQVVPSGNRDQERDVTCQNEFVPSNVDPESKGPHMVLGTDLEDLGGHG